MIQQIQPVRCKGGNGLPGLRYEDGEYLANETGHQIISEEKFDGHRALLHVGVNLDRGYLTSRRISKKTGEYKENGLNVPQIVEEAQKKAVAMGLGYTVFDCEIIVPGHPFEAVQTVMGSYPEKAQQWQEQNELAVLVIFDILFYEGADLRELGQMSRKVALGKGYPHIENDCIKCAKTMISSYVDDHLRRFKKVIEQGGEGLIIKDMNALYGQGWKKWKKEETYDLVVTGFSEGNNKYRGMFGAIEFGAYDSEQEIVYMGQCSGLEDGNCAYMDEEENNLVEPNSEGCILLPVGNPVNQPIGSRAWFHTNREELIGSVVEVKCNGLTKHGKLRHPQFLRTRPDKPKEECLVPTK